MCNLNDFMRYANVVSKSYSVPQDKLELAMTDFFEQTAKLNRQLASMPFYSLEELPDNQVFIKMYLSLQYPLEDLPQGMHFDSYFNIGPMVSCAVYGDDMEAQGANSYNRFQPFFEQNKLIPVTPVFTVLRGDSDFSYAILKIGYVTAQETQD